MSDIENFFKKPAEKRYDHFIKVVADTEEVFSLVYGEEEWALLGDDEDDSNILPVFPTMDFARHFRDEADFEEFQVAAIDLNEFLEWLGDMESENMLVAVFPNTQMSSVVMEPLRLKADLQAELDKYDEDGKKIKK
jgi:Protein of unknown function (DUF2750)